MITDRKFNNPKWHQLVLTLAVLIIVCLSVATDTIFDEWIGQEEAPAEWQDIAEDTIFYFVSFLLLITPFILICWNLVVASTFNLPKLTYRQALIICTFYTLLTMD